MFLLDIQETWFLLYKTKNLCLKTNFKQFAEILEILTF